MNKSTKSRLAIDLDALEEQLKHSHGQPASAGERGDDPLSELARIVGQDDPFRTLLSGERAAATARPQPQRQEPQFEAPSFGHQGLARQATPASFPQKFAAAPPQPAAPRHEDYRDTYQPAAEAEAGDYADYAHGEDDDPAAEEPYQDPAPVPVAAVRRSRRGLMAVGTVVGVAAIGVAAAFALKGTGRVVAGEPPVIMADNAPTKIQPQNPGGVEIPNQNKEIYERVGQPGVHDTKVVDRSEQPVDVNQAVRRDTARVVVPTAGAPAQPSAAVATPAPRATPTLAFGEPKRVKTVAVKPDGSIMADIPPSAPAITSAPKPKTVATTPVAGPAPASAKPARILEAREEAADASRTSAGTPLSIAPLADRAARAQPAPTQVAATRPVEELNGPASTASTTTSSGAYTVQLAAPGSEKEARDVFASLQRKYTGDLSAYQPIIRKAETGGRTVYRLRVGALSREAATSLCTRLQGAGGACFVAKN